jgi:peptidoglycan/xylan/chitin deacetylase (PgdA/CDA1 family)
LDLRFWDSVANKRAVLARGLEATGATRALEALGGAGRSVVLTYHRIATPGPSNPFYDPTVSATPEGFRAQMAMLRDRFRVVPAEELIAPSDPADRRPRAVVTFDDGCRDNFDAALPVLREFGLPATFFIPTDFLERPRLPWWDHVAYVVKASRLDRFEVPRVSDDPAPIVVDLTTPDRSAAIMGLIRPVLAGEVADRDGFLKTLEDRAEVDVDSPALGRDLFMTWDQLKALAAEGHAIGSHAHSHVALGALDDRDARRELSLSRTILEAAAKRPVRTVAYPYGWPGAVNDRTFRLAAAVGYRIGFTAFEGVVRPGLDPLAMPRLNVGAGDTPPLLRARAALWGTLGRSWV